MWYIESIQHDIRDNMKETKSGSELGDRNGIQHVDCLA